MSHLKPQTKPQSFLILFNIAKLQNFGSLIRTANAFGANVVFVGKKDYSRCGATAKTRRTTTRHFYQLTDACDYVRSRQCRILGVEIMPEATAINEKPFVGSAAFLIGNEGTGLTTTQKSFCDDFVYIPQFGTAVSLNVNVATGIVLHHFAIWAKFVETKIEGTKFETGYLPDDAQKQLYGRR